MIDYLENSISAIPYLFVFAGGYYINMRQYKKNNLLLNNIEKLKLNVESVEKEENLLLKDEIKKLKIQNEKLLCKIDELKENINKQDKKIEEYHRKGNEENEEEVDEEDGEDENIKNFGSGLIRYKNEEGTMYYHGMGHLEKKYMWWEPYMNHKIRVYSNKDRKLKFKDFETTNIDNFCTNCEYCSDINKNKRNVFYYQCKGHKINIQ